MTESKARIFIVDDHPLVREWLTNLLLQQPDLTVCGEAEDSATALSMIASAEPGIAIIDLSLGEVSGFDLIRQLRRDFPALKILVLSMHDEKVYAERAMRAGAHGYIMKRETAANIVMAVRKVLQDRRYVSEQMVTALTEKFAAGISLSGKTVVERLSDRELEVFELLGRGYETSKIADTLHVSIKTIQTYCARIKEKLSLRNGAELFREAICWHEDRLRR